MIPSGKIFLQNDIVAAWDFTGSVDGAACELDTNFYESCGSSHSSVARIVHYIL